MKSLSASLIQSADWHRGMQVMINAKDPRAVSLLSALASGSTSVARDRLIELMAGGTGYDPWTGDRNGPKSGAGGWWTTDTSAAWTYASGTPTMSEDDDAIFASVIFHAEIDDSIEADLDGRGYAWHHLEPGTPMRLVGVTATLPTQAQARRLVDLVGSQGGWWDPMGMADLDTWQNPGLVERYEVEETLYEWPLSMHTEASLPLVTAGPASNMVPFARFPVRRPAHYGPRDVKVLRMAEQDIARLHPGQQARVQEVIEALKAGTARVERKERHPLKDTYTVRVTRSLRLGLYLTDDQPGGDPAPDWVVYWIGDHNYDEAERRMWNNPGVRTASTDLYVRFGEIPPNYGNSFNYRDEFEEGGVSVYRLGPDGMPVNPSSGMPHGMPDEVLETMQGFVWMHQKGHTPEAYVVDGLEVGTGSDGEPLLDPYSIEIVRDWNNPGVRVADCDPRADPRGVVRVSQYEREYEREERWIAALDPSHPLLVQRPLGDLQSLAEEVARDHGLRASVVVSLVPGVVSRAEYEWTGSIMDYPDNWPGTANISLGEGMHNRWTVLHEMVHVLLLTHGQDETGIYHGPYFESRLAELLELYDGLRVTGSSEAVDAITEHWGLDEGFWAQGSKAASVVPFDGETMVWNVVVMPPGVRHDIGGTVYVDKPGLGGDFQFRFPYREDAVGLLRWYPDGEISDVWVHPDYRRQGLATEMLRRAREAEPYVDIHHSEVLTSDGQEWSRRVSTAASRRWLPERLPPSASLGSKVASDYRGGHQPDPDGPPLHDLLWGDMAPRDVYEHPEYYTGFARDAAGREAIEVIDRVRGNPDAMVTIYRSLPPNVPQEINPGDWVTLSRTYAQMHGDGRGWEEWVEPAVPNVFEEGEGWVAHDDSWPVVSRQVPAWQVRWDVNDLVEMGWFPNAPRIASRIATWSSHTRTSAKTASSLSLEYIEDDPAMAASPSVSGQEFEDLCTRVLTEKIGKIDIEFDLLYAPSLNEGTHAAAWWDAENKVAWIGWSVAGLNVATALHECAHIIVGYLGIEDGHGPNWEVTYRDLLAQYGSQHTASLAVVGSLTMRTYHGKPGRRDHITGDATGMLPIEYVRNMPGKMGEVPGAHRNKQGQEWEDFKADILANGIIEPIFIICEENGTDAFIYEGNHRRDAAVEVGMSEVPVHIRFFGKSEDVHPLGALPERLPPSASLGSLHEGAIAPERQGQCYPLAYEHLMTNDDGSNALVHGTINGGATNHAWVEWVDTVYDPVLDEEFTRDFYYTNARAVAQQTYTADEAEEEFETNGHYGPWDGSVHTAMAATTGIPEIDALIEDFKREPLSAQNWGPGGGPVSQMSDPYNAHGYCQMLSEQFVEFARRRGFRASTNDLYLDEIGYTPTGGPYGEVLDADGEIVQGYYPEHTVAVITVDDGSAYGRDIYIDFTAAQYGYTDFPKVTGSVLLDSPSGRNGLEGLSTTAVSSWKRTPGGQSYRTSIVGKNGLTYYITGGPEKIEAFTEKAWGSEISRVGVGRLVSWEWNGRREIYQVGVNKEHRRQGVASAMLALAREFYPDLIHAGPGSLSDDGAAWAAAYASLRTASAEREIVVSAEGHLWTWRCSVCGEGPPNRGYRDKAYAHEMGYTHAQWCWDLGWDDIPRVVTASGLMEAVGARRPIRGNLPGYQFVYEDDWSPPIGVGFEGIAAVTREGYAGHLSWDYTADGDPYIAEVWIEEGHRRKGVATELLRLAREIEPTLAHSADLSDMGRSWMQAVGATPGPLTSVDTQAGAMAVYLEDNPYPSGTTGLAGHIDGVRVCELFWWVLPEGTVSDGMTSEGEGVIWRVWTRSGYRRQGLASSLLRIAREIEPTVRHSTDLTDEGRAWSERVAAFGADSLDITHRHTAALDEVWPVADILPLRMNDGRKTLNPDQVAKYVADIRAGLTLSPVFIESAPGGEFLSDGHHRLEAAVQAGLTHLPVRVFDDRWEALKALNEVERAKTASLHTAADLMLHQDVFYRTHDRMRAFSVDDATSSPLNLSFDDHLDAPREGYSACYTPWELWAYVVIQGWTKFTFDDDVLIFSGDVVGDGVDSEPLVVPDHRIERFISWRDFLWALSRITSRIPRSIQGPLASIDIIRLATLALEADPNDPVAQRIMADMFPQESWEFALPQYGMLPFAASLHTASQPAHLLEQEWDVILAQPRERIRDLQDLAREILRKKGYGWAADEVEVHGDAGLMTGGQTGVNPLKREHLIPDISLSYMAMNRVGLLHELAHVLNVGYPWLPGSDPTGGHDARWRSIYADLLQEYGPASAEPLRASLASRTASVDRMVQTYPPVHGGKYHARRDPISAVARCRATIMLDVTAVPIMANPTGKNHPVVCPRCMAAVAKDWQRIGYPNAPRTASLEATASLTPGQIAHIDDARAYCISTGETNSMGGPSCGYTTEIISEEDPTFTQVWGAFLREDGSAPEHVWLTLGDGTIVDPTADQFGYEPIRVLRPGAPGYEDYLAGVEGDDLRTASVSWYPDGRERVLGFDWDTERFVPERQAATHHRWTMRYLTNALGMQAIETRRGTTPDSGSVDGFLTWKDGVIDFVRVENMRRSGLATFMLEFAREITPGLRHSPNLLPDGRSWMEAVGSLRSVAAEITYRVVTYAEEPWIQDDRTMVVAEVGGARVGHIIWDSRHGGPMIDDIQVIDAYRRQGIATEMLRRAREIEPNLQHSDSLTDDGEAWAKRVGAVSGADWHRGMQVMLNVKDPRAVDLLDALAGGATSVARDRLIELMAGGVGYDPWTGNRNGPQVSAGGWWTTDTSAAWTYASGIPTSGEDDDAIFASVIFHADISDDIEAEYDGRGYGWHHLDPGTPITLTGVTATLPTPAQARKLAFLARGQGGWWDPMGMGDLDTWVHPGVHEKYEVEEQIYEWPMTMHTEAKVFVPDDPSRYGDTSIRYELGGNGPVMDPKDLPSTVYHVTTAGSRIGGVLNADFEMGGGLGGNSGEDRSVSFTIDRSVAQDIAVAMRLMAIAAREFQRIGGGQDYYDYLVGLAAEEGWTFDGDGRGWLDPYRHWDFGDWMRFWLQRRTTVAGKRDPLFFGVKAENWARINPEDVGYVTASREDIIASGAMVTDFDLGSGSYGLKEIRVWGDVKVGGFTRAGSLSRVAFDYDHARLTYDKVRNIARQYSLYDFEGEATALARRVLSDAGFPEGDQTKVQFLVGRPDLHGVVAWDTELADAGIFIPLIMMSPRSANEFVLLHECAHILRNGPEMAGRMSTGTDLEHGGAHDQRWWDTLTRLIAMYGSDKLASAFRFLVLPDVDPSLLRAAAIDPERQGMCYPLAYQHLMANDDGQNILVHGTINGTVNHAWVQWPDTVYDPVLDEEFTREHYYIHAQAVPEMVYTPDEAEVQLAATGHYGPWDGSVSLAHKEAMADSEGYYYHYGTSIARFEMGQYVHVGTREAAEARHRGMHGEGNFRHDGTLMRVKIAPRNPLGSVSSPLDDHDINILLWWEGFAVQSPGEMPSEDNGGDDIPWQYKGVTKRTPRQIAAEIGYQGAWTHDAFFYRNQVEDRGSVSVAIDPDCITEQGQAPPTNPDVGPGQLLLWGRRATTELDNALAGA